MPTETVAGRRIVAGFDVDDNQDNGTVEVESEFVTFRAPEIILETGFTGGINFTAIEEETCLEGEDCNPTQCCTEWEGFTLDPLQNYMTPNGDGVTDVWQATDVIHPFCAFSAEEFHLRVFNRWDNLVFEVEDSSPSCCSYQSWAPENNISHSSIFWDGTINENNASNNGVYFIILELSACGNTESFATTVTQLGSMMALTEDNEIEETDYFPTEAFIGGGDSSLEGNHFNKVNVYPNPTSDLLWIEGLSESCKITVSELGGSEVLIMHTFESSAELNLAELSSGYYLVQLFYPKLGSYYQELIIKE